MMIRGIASGISLCAFNSRRGFIGTLVRFRPPQRAGRLPPEKRVGLVEGYCRLISANQNGYLQGSGRSYSAPMLYALAQVAQAGINADA